VFTALTFDFAYLRNNATKTEFSKRWISFMESNDAEPLNELVNYENPHLDQERLTSICKLYRPKIGLQQPHFGTIESAEDDAHLISDSTYMNYIIGTFFSNQVIKIGYIHKGDVMTRINPYKTHLPGLVVFCIIYIPDVDAFPRRDLTFTKSSPRITNLHGDEEIEWVFYQEENIRKYFSHFAAIPNSNEVLQTILDFFARKPTSPLIQS
jgi:hypothetical protein